MGKTPARRCVSRLKAVSSNMPAGLSRSLMFFERGFPSEVWGSLKQMT